MTDERFERASRIFIVAKELDRAQRDGYVQRECAGDDLLRAEVDALLRGAEGALPFATLAAGLAGVRDRLCTQVMPRTALPDELRGVRIGPYTVAEQLGEGGFGWVFRAEQEHPIRRSVALKLIKSGMDTASVVARFEAERQALALMDHPGIARVFDAGSTESGRPFFVMELVEGGVPITAYCDAQRLTIRERLLLFIDVCRAVQHAHQKGIIHRDLKPSNVLVRAGDTGPAPKVIDFGIAKATDSLGASAWTMHTAAAQPIGTPAYMSPEQMASGGQDIDTRTDVYSLGVLLYELLTGSTPFDPTTLRSRSPAEIERVLREVEPVRPSVRIGSHARVSDPTAVGAMPEPDVEEIAACRGTDAWAMRRALIGDLDWIVMKCLEKDRTRRYETATALASDVQCHLRHEPVAARPPSRLYRARKFTRRNRQLVVAGGLVLFAMAGATTVSVWQAGAAVRSEHRAQHQQQRADEGAAAALRGERRAVLAGAAAALESGDPITANRLLAGADHRGRGWGWNYWHSRLDQSVAMIRPEGRIAGAWMSPDGEEAVVITDDGAVRRGSVWSGELPQVAQLAHTLVTSAVFTDEARRAVVVYGERRRGLGVFDTANGGLVRQVADLTAPVGLLDASADGTVICAGLKRIVNSLPADDIRIWRATDISAPQDGRQIQGGVNITDLCLSRDGRLLIAGFDAPVCWDTASLAQSTYPVQGRGALHFAVTDIGGLIATGGEDKIVRLSDCRTQGVVRSMVGHAGDITALEFDPAGETLASASKDLTIRLWDTRTGASLATLFGHTARIRRLQFDGDGRRLMSVSDDGSIRFWERDPSESTCVLRGHSSYVYAVAFAPDGSRVFSGAWDQSVRIWSAAGGEPMQQTPMDFGFITALAVAPDGRTFVTGHKVDEWSNSPVWLWDAATGRPIAELARGQGAVCDLVFSSDGTHLWVAWDHRGVEELDLTVSPPARRRVVTRSEPRAIALSADETILACGHINGTISLIATASGKSVRRLEGHKGWIGGLAFHPTSNMLASASADGTARLWDADTGECTAVLKEHWDKVYAVAFSPDGTLLATGSEDTTITIWDVSDPGAPGFPYEITRLRGHEAYVYALAFSPDGTRLVSGSGDQTVRIWDTRPVRDRWRARHAEVSGPNQTPENANAPGPEAPGRPRRPARAGDLK